MIVRIAKPISLGVLLLSLLCLPTSSYGAKLLEHCQAMGFDLRNADRSNNVAYQNKELWEIKCVNASGVPETVKVCVDSSSQYGIDSTTPAPVYTKWQAILHESLADPTKRFAIWVEHQWQMVPITHPCKAGGYFPLTRICTIRDCFIGGHF